MASRIFQFIGWPVLAGIAAAAAILLFTNSNKWLQKNESDSWQGPVSYAEAVRRAAPSVVNIYSRRQVPNRPWNPILDDPVLGQFINARTPRTREAIGLGSGVIFSRDGHILTNLHVVSGADQINIQLQDGRTSVAEVVGIDKATDLAVLKVDLDQLTPIEAVNSMEAEVGQVVLAIGNPHGVGQTVTQGIISALGQKQFGSGRYRQYRESIQTDATIHPGNSGGALVDAYGRLLGINNATLNRTDRSGKRTDSYGISFAIPANDALKVLKDIREYGYVRRGYIGDVSVESLNERQMGLLGFEYQSGLMVTAIGNGGPASSAGLLAGDIIIGINGQRRTDQAYISQLMFDLAPGEVMKFEVVRGGKELALDIVATTEPSIPQS
ncbi:trypsin-like peptidase domain-containing protein [Porticoccus sp. W117]|uniref:S1C family serine protease n=1 Tax=Porticoccus sp. W117 TaxID=3054777 RepID=UPI00259AC942|nr:trypsin-like peptidase domain-containing protein [Porticoccus sp. W117]MDM3872397.1 trypsin-like peptidase domain-containing protein [Porticoccus sp. W117]